MCTVTWLRQDEGYAVLFNRDELRTRGPAAPPRIERRGDTAVVLPRDADAGGTWIGANDRGVTLALLNEYEPAPRPPVESRGRLVDGLLDARDLGEAERRLRAADLTRFAPFRLLAFSAGGAPWCARWRAEHLELRPLGDDDRPVTSSSRDPAAAGLRRRELLAGFPGRDTLAGLERFHESHEPERGALSPCMHRDDAITVSLTRVVVDATAVELSYRPGPPCERAGAAVRRLDRAGAPPRSAD